MTTGPLSLHEDRVRDEWIDYNGHMNMAYYLLAFDHATDRFLDYLGVDEAYRADGRFTTYTLEAHVTYERELKLHEPFRVRTQLLDRDEKRLHYFHEMYHAEDNFLAATNELMLLHVDRSGPRAAPFDEAPRARIEALWVVHRELVSPPQAGRTIGLRAGRPSRPAG